MINERDKTGRSGGFTLMELMVAISVSGLVIFFVGSLFNDMGNTISLGINKAQIAANSHTIGQVLYRDFKEGNMVGPSENGILIILNHVYEGQTDKNGNPLLVPVRSAHVRQGEVARIIHSDQLVFIRQVGSGAADPLEPLVAAGPHTYSNSSSALHARVWYGHVQRTEVDGSVVEFGETEFEDRTHPDHGTALNLWGNEWILGRQVLFLDKDALGFSTKADTAFANAKLSGGFTKDPTLPLLYKMPKLFHGLADVAAMDLSGTGDPTNAIIGDDNGYLLYAGQQTDGPNGYVNRAFKLTFGQLDHLRVNPVMRDDSRFESWRVAQMHPYLMANVSDFIVEFAADIYTMPNSSLINPDGEVDVDIQGNIIWYGFNNVPSSSWVSYIPDPVLKYAKQAFVWRHDYPDNWPYLIRVRYRLHDERGVLSENPGDPGIWFEHVLAVDRS